MLVVGAGGVWLLTRATAPKPGLSAADVPALQVQPAQVSPGAAVPVSLTAADPGGQSGGQGATSQPGSLSQWAGVVAAATGIPETAVAAYGNAELAMRSQEPACQISWATLAGIGRIESDHGQFGGAHLQANGEETRPIIGVPLDGTGGVANIPDTDHGALDGDPTHDRAVGPMQFLPSTWRDYSTADPENINNAALVAAQYLCLGGRDMGSAAGWWDGILSYNNSVDYAQKVFGQADSYAREAYKALTGSSGTH
ncbi:MAG TPA: murein transglycosylase [Pseudonocardiaceae bacterium]|nr:murein transglycosylase [Pseudonocardiaceae bacterium]